MVYWPAQQLNCSLYWTSLGNPWRVVTIREKERGRASERGGREAGRERERERERVQGGESARGESGKPLQTRWTIHRLQLNQTKLRAGKWIIIEGIRHEFARDQYMYIARAFAATSCRSTGQIERLDWKRIHFFKLWRNYRISQQVFVYCNNHTSQK